MQIFFLQIFWLVSFIYCDFFKNVQINVEQFIMYPIFFQRTLLNIVMDNSTRQIDINISNLLFLFISQTADYQTSANTHTHISLSFSSSDRPLLVHNRKPPQQSPELQMVAHHTQHQITKAYLCRLIFIKNNRTR